MEICSRDLVRLPFDEYGKLILAESHSQSVNRHDITTYWSGEDPHTDFRSADNALGQNASTSSKDGLSRVEISCV